MNRKSVLVFLSAAVLLIAGCGGNPVREKVESSVEQSLPDMVGPAKSYSVRAYGPTLRMMKGKLDGLDIVGTDVKLSSGITVSRLFVKIRDIAIDTDSHKLKKVGTTEYSATLTDKELAKYLESRYPDVPGLKLELSNDNIGVSATPGVSVAKVTVRADAGLLVRDQRILALDLKSVKVAGINTPEFARNYIQSKLDTIFDAKDMGFDARIKSTAIAPGTLTLNGDLDLMKLSEQKK